MADFTLGFQVDPTTGQPGTDPLKVSSGDLTTHGAIVGMTGSGKTGLAIVLLEEALSAGIPALILDPKGDLGNLLLTFPDLAPSDFRPWVNDDDARGAGLSLDDFAAKTAQDWKDGLAKSGITPDRIRALRDKANFTIYTPGSTAGVPLNVIGSLEAPTLSWDTEAETLRDEIEGAVISLLGLVGIEADPLSSREFVLLSNLIEIAWRAGQNLNLGTLIGQVQTPPIRKLGVFDLDTFFPPKDRTALALKLNGLVASPSFAAWGEGQDLDPSTLLRTADGKPRAAIVYLADLSDQERQFVVTLVLSKLVTWMRGQPGTSDLRTLVYMDEVFGFVPPTAAPPAKKPILTVLKQGRAFGVGMVLATQNPVDLDYKAMSNAGLWMVGRLQTATDKARVLEGLKSAAGGTDLSTLDATLGGLQKREFMLVSAKSNKPSLFQTRWAMSYLRGPLTKDQIQTLMKDAPRPAAAVPAQAAAPAVANDATSVAPPVAQGTTVAYLDPAANWATQVGATTGGQKLRAFLAARVALRFDDAAAGVDEQQEYEALFGPLDGGLDLDSEHVVDYDDRDFKPDPLPGQYLLPTAPIGQASFFRDAQRDIVQRLRAKQTFDVFRNKTLKLTSRPGETQEQFTARCDEAGQQQVDAAAAALKAKLEGKQAKLQAAAEIAQHRVLEATSQQHSRETGELVAGAGAVLGALLGGRRNTRSIANAIGRVASSHGQASTASQRVDTAQAKAQQAQNALQEVESEILRQVQALDAEWKAKADAIDTLSIRPEASDINVERLLLVWVPTA